MKNQEDIKSLKKNKKENQRKANARDSEKSNQNNTENNKEEKEMKDESETTVTPGEETAKKTDDLDGVAQQYKDGKGEKNGSAEPGDNKESAAEDKQKTEDAQSVILNELKEKYAAKEKLCNEYLDRLQRSIAEFDNYKKRTQREKEGLYLDAVADVIAAFLPIVDNLERAAAAAVDAAEEDKAGEKSLQEGINLIEKQVQEILKKLGAEPLPSVGEQFDPNYHNAVMHIEDEQYGKNVIVEEFQKGYRCKDRIVRHSMVKVAN